MEIAIVSHKQGAETDEACNLRAMCSDPKVTTLRTLELRVGNPVDYLVRLHGAMDDTGKHTTGIADMAFGKLVGP